MPDFSIRDCADCPVIRHIRMCRDNAVTARRTLQADLEKHMGAAVPWWHRLSRKWRQRRRTEGLSLDIALSRSGHNADYCTRLLELVNVKEA